MGAGMPYERRLTVFTGSSPTIVPIRVPPRGYIKRLIMQQRGAADDFDVDIYKANPAVSASVSENLGFNIEMFRASPQLSGTAGLLSELALDIPYDLTIRDSVGRVIPFLYFVIDGTEGTSVEISMVIDLPTARS